MEEEFVSNCCSAKIEEGDRCSKCKEPCECIEASEVELELKTLKDLKWFTFCTYVPGKIGNAGMEKIAHKVFTEGDLKEAAIAHAKNIQQFQAEHTINFIKHFFNLTDEDLK